MPDESLEDPDGAVEHFAPTGGRITGVLGLVLAGALLVTGVVWPGTVIAPVMVAAAVGGVVSWAALLRPRVSVDTETLYLRNMLETVEVPLAAVDELVVRQMLVARVGEKKYVCPGIGRKVRKMVRAPKPTPMFLPGIPESIPDAVGPTKASTKAPTDVDYVDHVESRLRALIGAARERHGVTRYSDEALAAAAGVRRMPARPEVAALAVGAVAFVVTLFVG